MNAQTKVEAPTLAAAMADAFGEIEAATKAANNPHFKSKYADLGAVIDAIKPALIGHGLFFTQHPEPIADGVCIETVLHHSGGESLSMGKLFVPANKRDAQGFGSALTYARRYALMTAFGVPAEDDDGNAGVASNRRQESNDLIDDAQFSLLIGLIEATGSDTQRFCQYMKVPSVKQIRAADFDKARAALEVKTKKPAKEVEPA